MKCPSIAMLMKRASCFVDENKNSSPQALLPSYPPVVVNLWDAKPRCLTIVFNHPENLAFVFAVYRFYPLVLLAKGISGDPASNFLLIRSS